MLHGVASKIKHNKRKLRINKTVEEVQLFVSSCDGSEAVVINVSDETSKLWMFGRLKVEKFPAAVRVRRVCVCVCACVCVHCRDTHTQSPLH